MLPPLPKLTISELADLLKVSQSTVSSWVEAGMPAVHSGRQRSKASIDLRQAMPWVIAHREARGGERERLASEQADKIALENARKRGELLHADQVAEVLAKLGAELAARHDAVPGRVAGELAGLTDPGVIRGRLLEELRAVRGAVADAAAELADALGADEEAVGDPATAAEPDGEPVGRRKPRTARRKRRARAVEE